MNRPITGKFLQSDKFSFGYFLKEKGIDDFLQRKKYGWYIKGQERLFSGINQGKSFLEIQELVITDPIKLNL